MFHGDLALMPHQVFLKGSLWVEAFEGHLAHGGDLTLYLQNC